MAASITSYLAPSAWNRWLSRQTILNVPNEPEHAWSHASLLPFLISLYHACVRGCEWVVPPVTVCAIIRPVHEYKCRCVWAGAGCKIFFALSKAFSKWNDSIKGTMGILSPAMWQRFTLTRFPKLGCSCTGGKWALLPFFSSTRGSLCRQERPQRHMTWHAL